MIEESTRQALAATVGHETILLVEDESVIRMMLAEVLAQQGYAVLQAGQGAQALALADHAAKPVNLLVTDMSMPGMTGWDLANQLRARRPELPVLFMSGHNDHETASWGKMAPPVEHLFKPFSLEAFLYKAREMLDAAKNRGAPGLLKGRDVGKPPGLPKR